MARISTYKKDTGLNPKDKLVGSSYVGLTGGVPSYTTSSYTLGDLSEYFAGFVSSEGFTYDLAAMYESIQGNIASLASVSVSLTALADETQALAQADIDLQTQFTTDISAAISSVNVTLTSLSNADLALASAVTNLETSFTTDIAAAVATINTELTTLSTADSALATSITELETTFTTDLSEAVSTINTSLTSLSSENQALAQSITTLTTTVNNIPTTIRQPDEPDVNAYPLGTIWVDTDDNNSLYILAEGTPNFWQATTSEALGDLIQSTAQLQQDLFTLATDTSALAQKTDTLTAQFGTYNPATNTFTFLATSDYFNQVKTYVDVDSALASEVTSLTATVETLDTDVNARIDTTNETIATETTARATAITALEASIDDETSARQAAINTVSQAVVDEATARATAITELEASIDDETSAREAAITTVSQTVIDEATARANAVTTLEAAIEDETSAREAAITSVEDAIIDESTARVAAITTLEAAIEDEATARGAAINTVNQAIIDETTARTSADTTLSSSISVKPNVFRQASAPAVTEPVGSIWYDSDDGNKMYVLVAGTPRVWTETTDQRLPNVITSAATATTNIGTLTTDLLAQATKITKLQAQYTFDGSGNVNGLADGTVVAEAVNDAYDNAVADADAAAATRVSNLSATISKIYKQASAPTGAIPVNSIWYDTDDSNKSYVYDGSNWIYTVDATRATTASVQEVSDAVGTINGKLVASYALTVTAGKVAGMKLLADNTTSEISFQADKFKIFNSTSDIAPFVLDGSSLKLNVPLNGVSGTFAGALSAATGTFAGTLSAGDVTIENNDIEVLGDVAGINYRHSTNGSLNGTILGSDSGTINIGGRTGIVIRAGLDIGNFGTETVSLFGDLTVSRSISALGNITAYASSDERLKENITPIKNAIDKINSIGGYEFDWNDNQTDYKGHDIGVIAQEIQAIAPEIVTERQDGYLAVRYEKLVAVLIQGMKEQQAQIEELKNKVDGLTK